MSILINIIFLARSLLELLVIASVILSYIMDYYHPVRRRVDAIVEPMLMPIRRVVPLVGMMDFSPLILLLLIRIVSNLIIKFL